MKIRFIACILLCTLLSGCGSQTVDTWSDETTFGDINVDAEAVDIYSVEEEFEIDKYLNIEELNRTNPNEITVENFRLYYNRIAQQSDIPYIMPDNYEEYNETNTSIQRKYEEGTTGVYLHINKQTDCLISSYSEYKFNAKDEEQFYESINRIFAPVFGGMPNLKKYDLNKIYFGIADAMKEEKGEYEYTYNKISLTVQRDYGFVYVTVSFPFDFDI